MMRSDPSGEGDTLGAVAAILSHRSFVALALVLWTIAFVSSPWWLTPGGDDGFYLYQVISFLRDGTFAVPFFDDWHRVYSNLPGYPAAQGTFFAVWTTLGLPFDVYTHRAFQIVCASALVFVGAALVRRAALEQTANSAGGRLAVGLFLVILGVTPFPLDVLFMRPEALGTLLAVTALFAFAKGWPALDARWVTLAGVALGGSMTTHPTFVVASGVTAAAFGAVLLWRRAWRSLAVAIITALVPLALMVSYYVFGGATAWDEIVHHIAIRRPSPGGAVVYGLGELIWNAVAQPSPATLFLAIPFVVLVGLILVAAALLSVRLVRAARTRVWPFGPAELAVHAFFLGNLVNLVLDSSGKVQIFTPTGFAAALSVAALVAPGEARAGVRRTTHGTGGRKAMQAMALAAGVLCVGYVPASHVLKRMLLSTPRFSHQVALAQVVATAPPGQLVLGSGDRFLMPFAERMMTEALSGATPSTALVFPHTIMFWDELALGYATDLACRLHTNGAADVLWGVERLFVRSLDREGGRAVFFIPDGPVDVAIDFRIAQIPYEFADGLYLRGTVEGLTVTTRDGGQRLATGAC